MKLTLGQAANEKFFSALVSFSDVKTLPPKYKWDLSESVDIVLEKAKRFEKQRAELIAKYDLETTHVDNLPTEKREALDVEWEQLTAIEFEIPIEKMTVSYADLSTLSALEIKMLKGLLFDKPEA